MFFLVFVYNDLFGKKKIDEIEKFIEGGNLDDLKYFKWIVFFF